MYMVIIIKTKNGHHPFVEGNQVRQRVQPILVSSSKIQEVNFSSGTGYWKNGLQTISLACAIFTRVHCWCLVHLKELTTATNIANISMSGQTTDCGGLLGSLSLDSFFDFGFFSPVWIFA